jgi:hypothetical protein
MEELGQAYDKTKFKINKMSCIEPAKSLLQKVTLSLKNFLNKD